MKKIIILALSIGFGLALCFQVISAMSQSHTLNQQVIGWTTNGPYGGSVVNVAVDPVNPLIAYVSAQQTGVFGTQDGGQSWSLLLHDPDWLATSSECLVTHPKIPGMVFFAGSQNLHRSDDYGQTWTIIQNAGSSIQARVVVIDSTNSDRIFVGLSRGQILSSLDGGDSWTQYSVGMPAGISVDNLALDGVITSTLYAGSREGGGIYRSINNGESWELNPGQPLISDSWSLAVSPFNRRIYQGGWFGPFSYSPDQGATWYTLTVGTTPDQHKTVTINFHPSLSQTLFLGDIDQIWRSTNLGKDWESIAQDAGWDIAIHPVQTNTLYAVGNGVKVSIDHGNNWETKNEGITAIAPREIAIAQTDADNLLVGASGSKGFYSLNGGQDWFETEISIFTAVAFHPVTPTVAFVGSGNEIYKSENSGVNWAKIGNLTLDGLPPSIDRVDIRTITIHPITPTILFAGVGFNSDSLPILQEGGLYKSVDAGVNWERIDVNLPISRVNTIEVASTPPFTMYMATGRIEYHLEQGNGIFRSTDLGETWQAVNTGLPDLNIRTVKINPNNPNELLCAPWQQINYAGGLGVYRSTNSGETWVAANSGLSAWTVEDFEFDPVSQGLVYAATWDGLFMSADNGQTWSRWNDTIGQVPILSISSAKLKEDESIIFAGVSGGSAETKRTNMTSAAKEIVNAGVYSRSIKWQRIFLPLIMK